MVPVSSREDAVDRNERREALAQLDEWLRTPMLLLSVVWLGIVILELTGSTSDVLLLLGTIIWGVFLLEFAVRLTLAPAKLAFLRENWLTVIALIVPALRLFRAFAVLRAARVLRGVRLVRVVGTVNRGMNALRRTLQRRRFGYVLALTTLILLVGAAAMLSFEPASEVAGGFNSYGHALWWTGMLIATIGTDFWPQSPEGRLLSSLLAVYGLGVFGYIAATFASFFIGRDAEAPDAEVAGSAEIALLREEIRQLREAVQAALPARP
jgi:voltage-gated potassium channel